MKVTRNKLRILLVDDQLATVERLAQIVMAGVSDLRVAITTSEEAAKEQLLTATPDLLILDLSVKRGSGLNVLAVAKDTQPRPVIIALFRSSSPEIRSRAVQLGADYFLEHANDTDALISIVRSVVGRDVNSDGVKECVNLDGEETGLRNRADEPKPLH